MRYLQTCPLTSNSKSLNAPLPQAKLWPSTTAKDFSVERCLRNRHAVQKTSCAQRNIPWYFNLDWKHKEVVLVGMDQESTYRRLIDFTPVGAEAYLRFFKQELIPTLEKEFQITQDRTYMGVSLGALFGAVLLADEPIGTPFFKNYLLVDGTFNFLTSKYIDAENTRFNTSHELNVQLILNSAVGG